jgi:hypothetical protein
MAAGLGRLAGLVGGMLLTAVAFGVPWYSGAQAPPSTAPSPPLPAGYMGPRRASPATRKPSGSSKVRRWADSSSSTPAT